MVKQLRIGLRVWSTRCLLVKWLSEFKGKGLLKGLTLKTVVKMVPGKPGMVVGAWLYL